MSKTWEIQTKHILGEVYITSKLSPREEKLLKAWLELTLDSFWDFIKKNKFSYFTPQSKLTLSILFCGDQKMRLLNSHYRCKDKTTDVLSFPSYPSLRKKHRTYTTELDLHLGDLAVSIPVARRQAKEFDIPFPDEMIQLLHHGLLHLLGFDHEISNLEEKLMESHEAWLLKRFKQKKLIHDK